MSRRGAVGTGRIMPSWFPDSPKIKVSLHEALQQFGSLSENQRFNLAMLQPPGYLTAKSFGWAQPYRARRFPSSSLTHPEESPAPARFVRLRAAL